MIRLIAVVCGLLLSNPGLAQAWPGAGESSLTRLEQHR